MNKKTKNNIWCIPAEVEHSTIFMMGPPVKFIGQGWPKFGLRNVVSRYFTWHEGDFCKMCYIRDEFDKQSEYLAEKIINNSSWALKMIKTADDWSYRFFESAKKFRKINFTKLNNRELIIEFKRVLSYHIQSHGIGSALFRLAEMEHERVSRYIFNMIDEQIKLLDLRLSSAGVFSTLSAPRMMTIINKEEKNFLELGCKILKHKNLKIILAENNPDQVADKIKFANREMYQKIVEHYQKYCWIYYQYKGPAYSLVDLIGRLQILVQEKISPKEKLSELLNSKQALLVQKKKLLPQLELNGRQQELIQLMQKLIYNRDYRKMALYHGMYCYEPFFKEAGERIGLSLDQLRAMNYWEIIGALSGNSVSLDELNQRLKFCVAYCDRKKYKIYIGLKAKKFLSKIKFEKVKTIRKNVLKGFCACHGNVTGKVKIINKAEETDKIAQGEIMVAHTTFPALVPAMRKAAAIVTDIGGVTSHAAIITREFNIPCIIGTQIATQVLRDNDLVEINADDGTIKIIK